MVQDEDDDIDELAEDTPVLMYLRPRKSPLKLEVKAEESDSDRTAPTGRAESIDLDQVLAIDKPADKPVKPGFTRIRSSHGILAQGIDTPMLDISTDTSEHVLASGDLVREIAASPIEGSRNALSFGLSRSIETPHKSHGSLGISDIHLEGESDLTVPVYDSCDELRKKIKAHLAKLGTTQGQFIREIAKIFTDGTKFQTSSLKSFLSHHGESKGRGSKLYYAAYCFFEKLRLKEGTAKSEERLKIERLHEEGLYRTSVTRPIRVKSESPDNNVLAMTPKKRKGWEERKVEIKDEHEDSDSDSPLESFLTPSNPRFRPKGWLKEEEGTVNTPGGTKYRCGEKGLACGGAFCFKCGSAKKKA